MYTEHRKQRRTQQKKEFKEPDKLISPHAHKKAKSQPVETQFGFNSFETGFVKQ